MHVGLYKHFDIPLHFIQINYCDQLIAEKKLSLHME